MRVHSIAAGLVAGAMLCAASAQAQLDPVQVRNPDPGTALTAAGLNVIFVPVRVAATAVGAVLGGATGWLTAGNTQAADSVWYVFDGPQFLQPSNLYGERPLEVGDLQFNMHVMNPR